MDVHRFNTESIANALGGPKAGRSRFAQCPAQNDCTPSLSIRYADHGKVLVRWHAGCDQEHVIAALRRRGVWAKEGPRPLSWKAASHIKSGRRVLYDAHSFERWLKALRRSSTSEPPSR